VVQIVTRNAERESQKRMAHVEYVG